jgi:hypothetical protein
MLGGAALSLYDTKLYRITYYKDIVKEIREEYASEEQPSLNLREWQP